MKEFQVLKVALYVIIEVSIMKKIVCWCLLIVLVFAIGVTANADTVKRYIPCDDPDCNGRYMSSEYEKIVSERVACKKYPSTYKDVRTRRLLISEMWCTECTYYDMDSTVLTDWVTVCTH